MMSELKVRSRAVAVCCSISVFVQVTTEPTGTVIAAGPKAKFAILTAFVATGAGSGASVAVGAGATVGVGGGAAAAHPTRSKAAPIVAIGRPNAHPHPRNRCIVRYRLPSGIGQPLLAARWYYTRAAKSDAWGAKTRLSAWLFGYLDFGR